jgi:hypothetical protein
VTATIVLLFLSYIRNLKPEGRLVYYLVTILNAVRLLCCRCHALHSRVRRTGTHLARAAHGLGIACLLPPHFRWQHAQRPKPDYIAP